MAEFAAAEAHFAGARKYYGGQRVVFDYHFLNTTGAPIEAKSAFNFHILPRMSRVAGDPRPDL